MAFEVQDYKDLVRLLEEHPEWRAELRRLVLTDELLELPVIVRELAEAQRHAEQRLSRVEEQIALLTEAQRHAEERLSRVEEQIALLTEAQRHAEQRLSRVEEQIALLTEAQRRTEERLSRVEEQIALLTEAQRHAEQRLSRVEEQIALLAEAQRHAEERLSRVEEQIALLTEAQRHAEERLSRVEEQIALLAEAQRRTEERVEQLAEAQRHAEERLSRVEEQIALLTEAQRRTEERLARVEEQIALLAEAQRQMADEIRKMAADQRRISNDVADLKGTVLEWKYRNKATAYFGAVLRRARVVEMQTLEERLEASLTEEEIKDVLRLDLIVQGRLSRQADAPEVYLAVEISSVIDAYDVQRARHRSYLLRKAGFPTIPMVAGEHLTPGAEFETKEHSVPVMQDGKVTYWEEALQRWATN